jgi:hypothetical protein
MLVCSFYYCTPIWRKGKLMRLMRDWKSEIVHEGKIFPQRCNAQILLLERPSLSLPILFDPQFGFISAVGMYTMYMCGGSIYGLIVGPLIDYWLRCLTINIVPLSRHQHCAAMDKGCMQQAKEEEDPKPKAYLPNRSFCVMHVLPFPLHWYLPFQFHAHLVQLMDDRWAVLHVRVDHLWTFINFPCLFFFGIIHVYMFILLQHIASK